MPQGVSSNTTTPAVPATPAAQWSPEKQYLMETGQRILDRGGTTVDVYNYLQHYERLPANIKQTLTSKTVNPPTPEPPETPGKIEGVALHALQGMTFGFGDEAVGGLLGILNGQSWGEGVEEHRAKLEAFAQEHRVMALMGDIGGGFVGVGAGLRLGRAGLQQLGKGGQAIARGLQTVASPQKKAIARAGQVAGFGAASGAARGLGEGEGGVGERMGEAAFGAAAGALLGPALVLGGRAAIAGARPVARFASGTAARAGAVLGVQIPRVFTPQAQARALIGKRLAEDGISPKSLRAMAQEAHKAGQPVVFADLLLQAGAHRTLALLDDAARLRDPLLQQTLEQLQQLTTRQGEAGTRMFGFAADQIFRGLKLGTMTLYDAQDALMSRARTRSAPLYAKADEAVADVGDYLKEMLSGGGGFHKEWQTAFQRARSRIQSEVMLKGESLPAAVPELDVFLRGGPADAFIRKARALGIPETRIQQQVQQQFGAQAPASLPVKFLNYLKQELDEIVEPVRVALSGTETQGASRAGKKQIAEELAEFVGRVREQVPVYGDALDAFAGDVVLAKAGDIGRQHFGSNVPAERVRRALSRLETKGEKSMFKLGWLQGLAEELNKHNGKTINFAERFFGGNPSGMGNQRIAAIRALFPKQGDADLLIDAIHREARMFETFARHGRSPSHILSEAAEDMAEHGVLPKGVTTGLSLAPGRRPGVFLRAIGAGINRLRTPFVRDVSNEMSSLFLRGASDPFEVDALITDLIGTGSRRLQTQTQVGVAAALTAGQQAQQAASDPFVPVVEGMRAGAEGLGTILQAISRR